MKLLIKNIDKYKDVKLVKGLDLNKVKTSYRFGNKGISTKLGGNKWFHLPKGDGIFKSFNERYYGIRKNRIINEFVCQELCKQVGIDCPDLDPATYKGVVGLVTYKVNDKNTKLINGATILEKAGIGYMDNNLTTYMKAMDIINRKAKRDIFCKSEVFKQLYKICIFDFLTMQTDRHRSNLFFEQDRHTKKIKVAPLLDNEFAFFIQSMHKDFLVSNKSQDMDDFLFFYTKVENRLRTSKSDYTNGDDTTIRDIILLANQNYEYRNILYGMIKNLDINRAIENVEKRGFVIPEEYKEYMIAIIRTTKGQIVDQFNLSVVNNKDLIK